MQVYLSKAGSLLAPDSFMLAMDGEKQFNATAANQCSVEMLANRVKSYQNGMVKIEGHLKRLEGTDDNERYVVFRTKHIYNQPLIHRINLLSERSESPAKLEIKSVKCEIANANKVLF